MGHHWALPKRMLLLDWPCTAQRPPEECRGHPPQPQSGWAEFEGMVGISQQDLQPQDERLLRMALGRNTGCSDSRSTFCKWAKPPYRKLESSIGAQLGPPMAALAAHQLPSVQDGESPFSRLLGPRWAEICLCHLKEQAQFGPLVF